jgi:pectate lyase
MKSLEIDVKRIFLLLLLVVWTCETLASPTQIPAFPGAEGFGKYSVGGRGGDVYCVTNLKDAEDGSLRYGIQSAQGPRIIVFEVAGTIVLKSPLAIKEKSHLTLAGQTAPGIKTFLSSTVSILSYAIYVCDWVTKTRKKDLGQT